VSVGDLLRRSAAAHPDRVAVRLGGEVVTYAELDARADQCARALAALGAGRGDRVAVWLPKSTEAIAAMQGALRVGAAYVPCDPMAPPARIRTILGDCGVRVVVTTRARAAATLVGELAGVPALLVDDGPPWSQVAAAAAPLADPAPEPDELAYILYTSGSTGRPKGVCLSHRNALAFVEWSARTLDATADDRLANHAPLHFDLSVLDIYVAFMVGATVVLIPDEAAYAPRQLVELLRAERISIWYSVPTALILMAERGGLLDGPTPALRAVLFAGEPFPIKHLRALRRALPEARLLNLYGPTETNVCTFHEVDEIADDRVAPVPIGRAACGDTVWAVRADGNVAEVGEEGELMVGGPTVMLGYWGQTLTPHRTHATGDIVRRLDAESYEYLGRRDQMVKVRGHRIELGDVEAAIAAHPSVREAAVVVAGEGMEAQLVAFVSCPGEAPSLLQLKRCCAERLPRYMIVGAVHAVPELPRTRNGKVDRLELTRVARDLARKAVMDDAR
jgi:amino acid adenylation domain-containing protein